MGRSAPSLKLTGGVEAVQKCPEDLVLRHLPTDVFLVMLHIVYTASVQAMVRGGVASCHMRKLCSCNWCKRMVGRDGWGWIGRPTRGCGTIGNYGTHSHPRRSSTVRCPSEFLSTLSNALRTSAILFLLILGYNRGYGDAGGVCCENICECVPSFLAAGGWAGPGRGDQHMQHMQK